MAGRELLLVDTPGLFDTSKRNEEIKAEILKFIAITAPGPHIILLVIKAGRFTKEVKETYDHVCDVLDNKGQKFTIIVLTGGDDLEYDNLGVQQVIENAPVAMKKMISDTGRRLVVFNNRLEGKDREPQVAKLLNEMETLVKKNNGEIFRSDTYEDAEEALLEKEVEKRDAVLQKKEDEANHLKKRLRENQTEIEKLENVTKRKDELLQHKDRAFVQMERDYSQKLDQVKRQASEYEEKYKTLQATYERDLMQVRDETREDIQADRLDVTDSWFMSKLKRPGKALKKIFGI